MIDQHSIEDFRTSFTNYVQEASKILISSHVSPDDDSIGSVLSLLGYLRETFPQKEFTVAYSSPKIDRWSYFNNFDSVLFGKDIAEFIDDYDLFIVLDTSKYDRVSGNPEKISAYKGKKICIDHHSNIPDLFDLSIITEEQSSVSQMLFHLFFEPLSKINARDAETMLLGILGDTNWFNVNMKQSNLVLFDVVKRLVGDGKIDLETFGAKYKGYSSLAFTVIQEFVRNARIVEVPGWPKLIYSYITKEFVEAHGFDDLEVREGSHIYTAGYNKTMRDVPWGATFSPTSSGEVNCSLRSRPGSVDVSVIGKQMGINGGGHPGSGGLKFEPSAEAFKPEDCARQFIDWIATHSPTPYPEH